MLFMKIRNWLDVIFVSVDGNMWISLYNSARPPETSKSVRKRPKTHSFPLDAQVEIAFIIEIMPIY